MSRLTLAAVLVAILCAAAYGDTIVLTNGGKLHGKIVKETEKEVTIQLPNKGTITVNREQIESMEKNKVEGPRIAPPSESPLVPSSPGEKKPGDETEKEPEKDKPEASEPAEKKQKEEIDPELKKRIDILVTQLGLARKQHRGRRNNAITELTKIGKAAVPALRRALETGKTSKHRWGAAQVLGNIGDKSATDVLVRQLRDPDRFVRRESADALRKITKQRFGYDPFAGPQNREVAAKKWEQWWEKEKQKKAEEEKRKAEERRKKEAAEKAEREKEEKKEQPPEE